MATLRDIKNRIVGVKSTQKITKAMKMIAAVRIKRVERQLKARRPYCEKLFEIIDEIMAQLRAVSPQLDIERYFPDVPDSAWEEAEVLYTVRELPEPGQVPRLRWIQFHFAGLERYLSPRRLGKNSTKCRILRVRCRRNRRNRASCKF